MGFHLIDAYGHYAVHQLAVLRLNVVLRSLPLFLQYPVPQIVHIENIALKMRDIYILKYLLPFLNNIGYL